MFDLESARKELQAMEEVGRLRVRAGGRAFGVVWVAAMGGLFLLGLGFLPALLLGAAIGGAIAKAYVSGQTSGIIAAVCKKYDLPAEALSRDKYIVD
jgi:hypothetical protein